MIFENLPSLEVITCPFPEFPVNVTTPWPLYFCTVYIYMDPKTEKVSPLVSLVMKLCKRRKKLRFERFCTVRPPPPRSLGSCCVSGSFTWRIVFQLCCSLCKKSICSKCMTEIPRNDDSTSTVQGCLDCKQSRTEKTALDPPQFLLKSNNGECSGWNAKLKLARSDI